MGHHGDGLWRRDDCPIISHGGADESRKIPNVMILVGTNDISRGSDEQEALWESMMVCLNTTSGRSSVARLLTVCTVPMNARSLTASGRRHNEGVMRWNNILRKP